jgi:hypothetical protein
MRGQREISGDDAALARKCVDSPHGQITLAEWQRRLQSEPEWVLRYFAGTIGGQLERDELRRRRMAGN